MFFCEKLPDTRSPSVATEKKFNDTLRAVSRIIFDPLTGQLYPGSLSGAYWIPVTDNKKEGHWVEFYGALTGARVPFVRVPSYQGEFARVERCPGKTNARVESYQGGKLPWGHLPGCQILCSDSSCV